MIRKNKNESKFIIMKMKKITVFVSNLVLIANCITLISKIS